MIFVRTPSCWSHTKLYRSCRSLSFQSSISQSSATAQHPGGLTAAGWGPKTVSSESTEQRSFLRTNMKLAEKKKSPAGPRDGEIWGDEAFKCLGFQIVLKVENQTNSSLYLKLYLKIFEVKSPWEISCSIWRLSHAGQCPVVLVVEPQAGGVGSGGSWHFESQEIWGHWQKCLEKQGGRGVVQSRSWASLPRPNTSQYLWEPSSPGRDPQRHLLQEEALYRPEDPGLRLSLS